VTGLLLLKYATPNAAYLEMEFLVHHKDLRPSGGIRGIHLFRSEVVALPSKLVPKAPSD
jgi:hypothetical protein